MIVPTQINYAWGYYFANIFYPAITFYYSTEALPNLIFSFVIFFNSVDFECFSCLFRQAASVFSHFFSHQRQSNLNIASMRNLEILNISNFSPDLSLGISASNPPNVYPHKYLCQFNIFLTFICALQGLVFLSSQSSPVFEIIFFSCFYIVFCGSHECSSALKCHELRLSLHYSLMGCQLRNLGYG